MVYVDAVYVGTVYVAAVCVAAGYVTAVYVAAVYVDAVYVVRVYVVMVDVDFSSRRTWKRCTSSLQESEVRPLISARKIGPQRVDLGERELEG